MLAENKPYLVRSDISGNTYGRWKVLSFSHADLNRRPFYNCICTCGTERVVARSSLTSNQTRSCGCFKSEIIIENNKKYKKTHGLSANPIFFIWQQMMHRCYEEKNKYYHRYGGRGITVCKRWHDPNVFYEDLGDRPKGKSLDRIDNNKGYSPSNCKWSTLLEQNNNTRTNKWIVVFGESLTIAQTCRKYNIPRNKLRSRLSSGMSPEEAVK